jgi:hypothetical protein
MIVQNSLSAFWSANRSTYSSEPNNFGVPSFLTYGRYKDIIGQDKIAVYNLQVSASAMIFTML